MEDHTDPQVAYSSLSAGIAKYPPGYVKYKRSWDSSVNMVTKLQAG
jgi:hypothetical protein